MLQTLCFQLSHLKGGIIVDNYRDGRGPEVESGEHGAEHRASVPLVLASVLPHWQDLSPPAPILTLVKNCIKVAGE